VARQKTIAVTGATGRQGYAVARRLSEAGFAVRAIVRDPAGPHVLRLIELGAGIAVASFEDRAAMRAAFAGAGGLYAMQNFWQAGNLGEFVQARAMFDAALDAGVPHILYSGGAIPVGAGSPNMDVKAIIELLLRERFPAATVIRGAWFIEGMPDEAFDLETREMRFFTQPGQPHGWISVDDMGRAAVAIFGDPDAFAGRSVDLVSAYSTGEDMAAAFGARMGQPLSYRPWSSEEVEALARKWMPEPAYHNELLAIFRFFRTKNFAIDMARVAEVLPVRHTLGSWIDGFWRQPAGPRPKK
jgi:uncharacterized protein YbjT (DUF2867 family)